MKCWPTIGSNSVLLHQYAKVFLWYSILVIQHYAWHPVDYIGSTDRPTACQQMQIILDAPFTSFGYYVTNFGAKAHSRSNSCSQVTKILDSAYAFSAKPWNILSHPFVKTELIKFCNIHDCRKDENAFWLICWSKVNVRCSHQEG